MNQFCLTLTVLYFLPTIFCIFADSDTYVNKFAVHIEGGERVARSVAETHGFIHIGQVRILLLMTRKCLGVRYGTPSVSGNAGSLA